MVMWLATALLLSVWAQSFLPGERANSHFPIFVTALSLLALLAALAPNIRDAFVRYRVNMILLQTDEAKNFAAMSTTLQMVTRLCVRMELYSEIQVRVKRRTGHPILSVVADRYRAMLIVPSGFLPIARKQRAVAEAMLAHELAHIAHDDINRHLRSEIQAKIGYYVILPTTILVALLGIVAHNPLQIHVWWMLLAVSNLHRSALEYRYARQEHEHLADLQAVLYADGNALLQAVSVLLDRSHAGSSTHPSTFDRIVYIEQCMSSVSRWRMRGFDTRPEESHGLPYY